MYYLVQGNTASQIKVQLTRNDTGLPADLTDAEIFLKIRNKENTEEPQIVLTGTISDLAFSEVVFLFGFAIDNMEGYYEAEVEVVYTSGLIESVYELIPIKVRKEF